MYYFCIVVTGWLFHQTNISGSAIGGFGESVLGHISNKSNNHIQIPEKTCKGPFVWFSSNLPSQACLTKITQTTIIANNGINPRNLITGIKKITEDTIKKNINDIHHPAACFKWKYSNWFISFFPIIIIIPKSPYITTALFFSKLLGAYFKDCSVVVCVVCVSVMNAICFKTKYNAKRNLNFCNYPH